jgi:WD40 repeat protein
MDLEGRLVQAVTGASGDIRVICLHPISGELIISAQEGRVWETTGVPPLRVLRGRHRHASAVFWGADDTLFAPGPDETGAAFQSIVGTNPPAVLWTAGGREHGEVSVSGDGRRAAFGRYHSARPISILELHDNVVTQVAVVKPAGHIELVRLSPNGQQLLLVEREFTQVELIDVATSASFPTLDLTDLREISDVAWLDQGRRFVGLVSSISSESTAIPRRQIILWDASTGKRLVTVTNQSVGMVACSEPAGRHFAEAGVGFNVRIRDGATLEIRREFRAHGGHIRALAWHPTRPILATTSDDRIIRLWDLDKGVRIEELSGPLTPPTMLSFSPGGIRLAAASRGGTVHIWEPRCLTEPAPKK